MIRRRHEVCDPEGLCRGVEEGVAWYLRLDLTPGGVRGHDVVDVGIDPLPTRLVGGQVVIAVRAPSDTVRRRLHELLAAEGPRRRTVLAEVRAARNVPWWVLGPFGYGGTFYRDALVVIGGHQRSRNDLAEQKRWLLVVDAVTGEERPWQAPDAPRVHLPDVGHVDDELPEGAAA